MVGQPYQGRNVRVSRLNGAQDGGTLPGTYLSVLQFYSDEVQFGTVDDQLGKRRRVQPEKYSDPKPGFGNASVEARAVFH